MKRSIIAVSWIAMILLFCPVNGQCLDVSVHGRAESNLVLRDNDGFESGIFDHTKAVQWRNTL